MRRNPIESSNLASIGYEAGILECEFHDGSVYRYYGVPMEIYVGLMQADSAGGYLHSQVITKGYRYEKIAEKTNKPPTSSPTPSPQHLAGTPVPHAPPAGIATQSDAPALFNAIMTGKLDVVRILLRNNPKWVTARDKNGKTPLHYAVDTGDVAIVQLLIKNGADVNTKDNNGISPLWLAIHDGRIESAKCLIEFGADVNESDDGGRTLLHKAFDFEIIKMLVEYGADVNAKDNEGQTFLHYWSMEDCVDVEALVGLGADVNTKDNAGRTPLQIAYSVDVAKELVKLGADIYVRNGEGYTAIEGLFSDWCFDDQAVAILEFVQFLCDKDIKIPFDTIKDCLVWAIAFANKDFPPAVWDFCKENKDRLIECAVKEYGEEESDELRRKLEEYEMHEVQKQRIAEIKSLVERGDNVNGIQDANGRTFLFEIIRAGCDINMVKFLVSKGANVNTQDKLGKTPLHFAAEYGSTDILQYLISKGANVNAMDKHWNKIPLDYANTEEKKRTLLEAMRQARQS